MTCLSPDHVSEVIDMALDDATAFAAIEALYGLDESAVKRLMQTHLRPGSYRAWRRRVRAFRDRHPRYKV